MTEDKRKKSFVVYETVLETFRALPDDRTRSKFASALLEFGIEGTEPDFSSTEDIILRALWAGVRDPISNAKEKYQKRVQYGKRGGRPAKSVDATLVQADYQAGVPAKTLAERYGVTEKEILQVCGAANPENLKGSSGEKYPANPENLKGFSGEKYPANPENLNVYINDNVDVYVNDDVDVDVDVDVNDDVYVDVAGFGKTAPEHTHDPPGNNQKKPTPATALFLKLRERGAERKREDVDRLAEILEGNGIAPEDYCLFVDHTFSTLSERGLFNGKPPNEVRNMMHAALINKDDKWGYLLDSFPEYREREERAAAEREARERANLAAASNLERVRAERSKGPPPCPVCRGVCAQRGQTGRYPCGAGHGMYLFGMTSPTEFEWRWVGSAKGGPTAEGGSQWKTGRH